MRCDRRARQDLPAGAIDLSKTCVSNLVETLLTIYSHQTRSFAIYLGYIDPISTLSQQEEARLRKVFREFEVYVVVSNPFILPFPWKNGLASLVVVGRHIPPSAIDAQVTQTVDNGGSSYVSDKV